MIRKQTRSTEFLEGNFEELSITARQPTANAGELINHTDAGLRSPSRSFGSDRTLFFEHK